MSLQLVHSIAALRDALKKPRASGAIIGLVPTMGALHAGHAALIEQARAECGHVVASIFVNPAQFNRQDDYRRYPRNLDADVEFAQRDGVDLIFAPPLDEMYPAPQRSFVVVESVADHLCGKFRPGHFRGVATVVLKLLHIAAPDRAYFGEKDAQQLAVIRRMVTDLNVPVRIIPVPTVREADGLALSSRNQLLSPQERALAPLIYQSLLAARQMVDAGSTDVEAIRACALDMLQAQPELRVEYLEVVDAAEMLPVEKIEGPVCIATAVWVGPTRLIDNVLCGL